MKRVRQNKPLGKNITLLPKDLTIILPLVAIPNLEPLASTPHAYPNANPNQLHYQNKPSRALTRKPLVVSSYYPYLVATCSNIAFKQASVKRERFVRFFRFPYNRIYAFGVKAYFLGSQAEPFRTL